MDKETAWIGSAVVFVAGAILVGVSVTRDGTLDEGIEAGEEWVRPEGTPEELAETLSVAELAGRWSVFPGRESNLGLHADYARALGILGADAAGAVPDLAPYATHEDPGIRKAVLEALARMGEEGLPHLLDAIGHGALADRQAGDVRWDAAQALAGMDPVPASAVEPVVERLVLFEESVLARKSLAVALARVDPFPIAALARVRDAYYERSEDEGLSVAETAILRTVNLALQGVRPEPEGNDAGDSGEAEPGEAGEEEPNASVEEE